MKYPGKEAYHFPEGSSHESPCMSPYWRSQPIRQGKKRTEETTEHDKIKEETEEEDHD